MDNSSSSSSRRDWSSFVCLEYLLPRVASSSILAPIAAASFSFLWTLWVSSAFMRSKSETVSWVNFKSPSTFLLSFSTSPLDFFSRSKLSSASSKLCSSLAFTRDKWLQRSSIVWMSSSVFWRDSWAPFFSRPNLEIISFWCSISSLHVRIWSSLSALSDSAAPRRPSKDLISSPNAAFCEFTLVWAWPIKFFSSFSPLILALTSSTCFCTSAAIASTRTVLSIISWTADPPLCRARTSSFFWARRVLWTAVTFSLSSNALPMWASAMAIFSSYSALYWANLVHLRLGLIANHNCHQSQVLPMRKLRMVRCKQYKANFWSCIFLNVIRDALPLAWACRRARTLPILSSRTSSMKPKIPALKKTLVCPRRNFSLSSLMTSITAPAALLSFFALATAPAAMILYLALKSGYNILFGKPSLQIAIPANTPLHWYWCMISSGCTPPGCLCVFGTTQRMKDGSVE